MKKVLLLCFLLSSCAITPSHWNNTQVIKITDIHQDAVSINCSGDIAPPLSKLLNDLDWLHQYDSYVGTTDIDNMVMIERNTVSEFQAEVNANKSNSVYCQLKKTLVLQQTNIISHTIQGSLK